ncbi:MAG TPA: hypothetical protein VNA88_19570 [Candidatus Kapabacteria bacterium]|nr:hypothetical protein [Candidatus Kapabacteria bacterium]
MADVNRPYVSGMFRDRESAERAWESARTRGYTENDLDVMMTDDTRKKYFDRDDVVETELGNKALEGAGTGAAIGGTLGAIIAAVAAGVSTVALPGIGLVIAGPIAAALTGAGAGAATGGIIGALVGSGIPEERAKVYEEGVKSGGIVMGVRPRSDDDADVIHREWTSHGTEIHR